MSALPFADATAPDHVVTMQDQDGHRLGTDKEKEAQPDTDSQVG